MGAPSRRNFCRDFDPRLQRGFAEKSGRREGPDVRDGCSLAGQEIFVRALKIGWCWIDQTRSPSRWL